MIKFPNLGTMIAMAQQEATITYKNSGCRLRRITLVYDRPIVEDIIAQAHKISPMYKVEVSTANQPRVLNAVTGTLHGIPLKLCMHLPSGAGTIQLVIESES